jgi:type II secretory pathway pseudopilin PulG
MAERAREAGFGLLETIVCVALLIAGSVLALAVLPALVRASQAGFMHAAATNVARNAIDRARAVSAYYPAAAMTDPLARGNAAAGHSWALAPAAGYTAGVRVRRGLCGARAVATDVPMNVALAYDAQSDVLTVAVTYPPDPCDGATRSTFALSEQLAPASYAPQTRLPLAIADPARQ